MTLLQILLASGFSITSIIGLIGTWYKFQSKLEAQEKEFSDYKAEHALDYRERQIQYEVNRKEDRGRQEEDVARIKEVNKLQWAKIDEIGRWEILHEKEAWANRNDLELKIAALHGADQKLESMLMSVIAKLDTLIADIKTSKRKEDYK